MADAIASFIAGAVKMAADEMDKKMRAAYAQGVADGKRQAAEELRARVVGVLNDPPTSFASLSGSTISIVGTSALTSSSLTTALSGHTVSATTVNVRAARGSVAPTILGALSGSEQGKRPADIAAETGVPENSVRGALNKLRKVRRVAKQGEAWHLIVPNPEDPSDDEGTGYHPMNG